MVFESLFYLIRSAAIVLRLPNLSTEFSWGKALAASLAVDASQNICESKPI